MTSRRLLDFHDDYIERTSTTMSGIIGIIVGIIVLVIIVIIIVCFCVCRRRRGYTGRTLYSPAPQAHTTTTTTSYPANHTILYPAQQPMPQQPMPQQPMPQQPVNYQHYPAHPPPGQAPPPYPGPPQTGYHPGPPPYPMAAAGQPWHPQQQKLDSTGYTGGMDQSYLQKASAPPPEPY